MTNVKQSNHSLIIAAKLGDKKAFDQLIKADYKKLFNFIKSRAKDASEEDLTQETLIEAYKNIFRFKEHSSFSTWLCGIAKQIIQKNGRKRKPCFCQLNDNIAWSGKNPYEVIESDELYSYIHKFTNSLPPREKDLFRYRCIQKKPYASLAKETGISPSAAKKTTYRAHNKWKRFINKQILDDYG